ncbi:MAG: DUF421 domain-containing protein [Gemmatimonadaceae bacterium]
MAGILDKSLTVDWQTVFVPNQSLLEIFLRGTLMYLGMFAVLRIFRRQAGQVGISDLLVIVVIADAAQNGMAGDSKSVTEAGLLILTIVFWNFLLDLLSDKFEFFKKIIEPKAILLIENGKLMRRNMNKEMITYDELMSQLRQQGIENYREVKQCRLESDGHFSVIRKNDGEQKSKVKEQNAAH